jgi:DNA-binding GntR family transcriptional regulator
VLAVERIHHTPDAPVEICEIVFPGDRYELMYKIPVHD